MYSLIFMYYNLRVAAPAADPGKIGPRFFDPPPCFFDPPPCLFEALATIVWILYIYVYIYMGPIIIHRKRKRPGGHFGRRFGGPGVVNRLD